MKLRIIFWLSVVSLAQFLNASGQGFANLDFESANISQNQTPGLVNTSDALPEWNAGVGFVNFNVIESGPPQVVLLGTNGTSPSSIEGNFSVFLQAGIIVRPGGSGFLTDAFIRQTGLVPDTAQSILFEAQPGTDSLVLTFAGQSLPFIALETTPNFTLFGGDVSAFAGQSSELEFADWPSNSGIGWNLDSIEFSSQPVPEPNICGLLALGCLFFKLRRSN